MAQVDVRINGYSYSLGCADGEEDHLRAMAAKVEATVGMVKAAGGAIGEARTLIMAALLLADRVTDLEAGAPVVAAPPPAPALNPQVVERLVHAAEQAERIADALEAA
jgi:cell division protein ZapA